MDNADNLLFRASALGHIMPGPREKEGELATGVIIHLIDCFISYKYKRREEIENKFLDKGNAREEDAITLVSRINKTMFKKNSERLSNEFITGEPDIFLGKEIKQADETFDTKCSYSAFTFFRSQKELNKMYYWQGMGYMALTGAKKHTVAFCLVNGLPDAIIKEKRNAAWKLNLIDPSQDAQYLKKAKQIEINHIFDINSFVKENPHFEFDNSLMEWDYDIPMKERLFTFTFERNDTEIQKIYDRVRVCRKWINANMFKVVPEILPAL